MHMFIPLEKIPTVTAQEKGINYAARKVYTKKEVLEARALFRAYLAQHVPDKPITGPVKLLIGWCYPLVRGKRDGDPKTSKPDVDNANKLIQDIMTELGYWKDDAQVCDLRTFKQYATLTGIFVGYEEITREQEHE